MRAKISDSVKANVIREWLKGTVRDTNASKNGISAGAVSSIVNEWKARLDYPILDELREFTVTLKNSGTSLAQCASGLRLVVMLQNIGVDEDSENFGNSMGNAPQKDPPTEQPKFTRAECVQKLTDIGMENTDGLIDLTCEAWLGGDPGTYAGKSKSASVHPDSKPAWLTNYDNLMSGGTISNPNTAKAGQPKIAAVIANAEEAPAWVKSSIVYPSSNLEGKIERNELKRRHLSKVPLQIWT